MAINRGTTSGSPPPRGERPYEVHGGLPALYRARPAEPTAYFGPLLGDVFTPPPSPLFTVQGFSRQGPAALLFPVIALSEGSI